MGKAFKHSIAFWLRSKGRILVKKHQKKPSPKNPVRFRICSKSPGSQSDLNLTTANAWNEKHTQNPEKAPLSQLSDIHKTDYCRLSNLTKKKHPNIAQKFQTFNRNLCQCQNKTTMSESDEKDLYLAWKIILWARRLHGVYVVFLIQSHQVKID